MKYLKFFESERFEIYGAEESDIDEVFEDFKDDFTVDIRFCKKLHQFNVIDSTATNQDIKLGFKPYIQVRISSYSKLSPYELSKYINDDYFLDRQSEVVSKLDDYELELHRVYVEGNSIIFLIYTKNTKLYAKL